MVNMGCNVYAAWLIPEQRLYSLHSLREAATPMCRTACAPPEMSARENSLKKDKEEACTAARVGCGSVVQGAWLKKRY